MAIRYHMMDVMIANINVLSIARTVNRVYVRVVYTGINYKMGSAR
jgi:hypothetical protein